MHCQEMLSGRDYFTLLKSLDFRKSPLRAKPCGHYAQVISDIVITHIVGGATISRYVMALSKY